MFILMVMNVVIPNVTTIEPMGNLIVINIAVGRVGVIILPIYCRVIAISITALMALVLHRDTKRQEAPIVKDTTLKTIKGRSLKTKLERIWEVLS